MNTRLQVEHPVTEAITGIDLVREQIRVASGRRSFTQEEVAFSGHAIECRINAENPRTFAPSPGTVTYFHPPGGLGVRVDSGAYPGYPIPPYYDSLVGKLIVHGETAQRMHLRLRRASPSSWSTASRPPSLCSPTRAPAGHPQRPVRHPLAGKVSRKAIDYFSTDGVRGPQSHMPSSTSNRRAAQLASMQQSAFYRYQEFYPKRNGSPRNWCSHAGDERTVGDASTRNWHAKLRKQLLSLVKCLFASEPSKPLKPRSLCLVFFVEKNVRVDRLRTCGCLNDEEIKGQYEVCTRYYKITGMKKKGVLLPSSPRYVFETR